MSGFLRGAPQDHTLSVSVPQRLLKEIQLFDNIIGTETRENEKNEIIKGYLSTRVGENFGIHLSQMGKLHYIYPS